MRPRHESRLPREVQQLGPRGPRGIVQLPHGEEGGGPQDEDTIIPRAGVEELRLPDLVA